MGSLILCHKKKAKHPYEISRIHTRISTLEELCYYLCNNLYLIDYTIMNEQLCRWIADELEMQDLAVKLVELIRNHGSVEKFVVLCYMNPESTHRVKWHTSRMFWRNSRTRKK